LKPQQSGGLETTSIGALQKKGINYVVGVIGIAIISTQHLAKNNRVLQNFQWGTKPRGFA
jgi:hypothetical protein